MSTSSSPALGQQDPCLSPMSLFQIPQINRTTPRSSSWAWSVSLEITPPRFPTVLHSGGFPAHSEWVIFHCRYTRFLHLPSTDGHCIIVNNSAVNMEAQISVQEPDFSYFGQMPRSVRQLLPHWTSHIMWQVLTSWRNTTVFTVAAPGHFPSVVQGSPFPHICANSCYLLIFFNNNPSNRC